MLERIVKELHSVQVNVEIANGKTRDLNLMPEVEALQRIGAELSQMAGLGTPTTEQQEPVTDYSAGEPGIDDSDGKTITEVKESEPDMEPTCGQEYITGNGGYTCNLIKGHEGDHYDGDKQRYFRLDESGSGQMRLRPVGWSPKS